MNSVVEEMGDGWNESKGYVKDNFMKRPELMSLSVTEGWKLHSENEGNSEKNCYCLSYRAFCHW